jgi:hypothetical protein
MATVPGRVVVGIAGELIRLLSTIAYPRGNSRVGALGEMSTMPRWCSARAARGAAPARMERSYGQLEARLVLRDRNVASTAIR